MAEDERQIAQAEVESDPTQVAAPASDAAAGGTMVSSTVELPPRGRVEVEGDLGDLSEGSSMPLWALGVMFAAVAAIVAAVAIAMLVPPTLALDRVAMDFDATELESEELTSSVYASNVGYEVVGLQASGVDDDGTGQKVTHLDVALANQSFSVVVAVDRTYVLEGRQWVPGNYRITSVDATPTAPVLEELALADIEKVMGKVAPYRGTYLSQVYEDGTFEVVGSDLVREGDDYLSHVTIAMHATDDLRKYDGEVVATFQFFPGAASRDAGAWRLVAASADDAAWTPGLASVVGTWRGTLESSANTALILNDGRCLAGRGTGLTLVVSSYDAQTGQVVVTMRFVAHNHEGIPQDDTGTTGDVVVVIEDQAMRLDTATLEGSWVPVKAGPGQGAYGVEFLVDDGVWKVRVTSGVEGSDGIFALGKTEFIDTYVLERS